MRTQSTTCPYNSEHVVAPDQMIAHLFQCADRAQKAHLYEICPYNPAHHVLKENINEHIEQCSDRLLSIWKEQIAKNPLYSQQPLQTPELLGNFEPPPGFNSQEEVKELPKEEAKQPSKEPESWVQVKSKSRKKLQKKPKSEPVVSAKPKEGSLAEVQLSASLAKKKKNLKKKLKEIEQLEARKQRGEKLDPQQLSKISSKAQVEKDLKSI
mgnify:CR=1 FL=1